MGLIEKIAEAKARAADLKGDAYVQSVNGEILDYLKSAPNPGLLAETFFQNFDKALAKAKAEGREDKFKLPLGQKMDEIKETQQRIAQAMRGGAFSPDNLATFVKKVSRADAFEVFEEKLQSTTGSIDAKVLRWSQGSGARNLGMGPASFGLKEIGEREEYMSEEEKRKAAREQWEKTFKS